jgi:hypothetical protein
LQAEEDAHAQQLYAKRLREREEKERAYKARGRSNGGQENLQGKEKKDKCIVM